MITTVLIVCPGPASGGIPWLLYPVSNFFVSRHEALFLLRCAAVRGALPAGRARPAAGAAAKGRKNLRAAAIYCYCTCTVPVLTTSSTMYELVVEQILASRTVWRGSVLATSS